MSGEREAPSSAHGVEFLSVADPLQRDPRLDFAATLPVLGIATRFESNSRHVLGMVEESFGMWRALDESVEADSVCVRVVVGAGDEGAAGEHAPVRHLSPGDGRLILQSPGSVAVSDGSRRSAVAYVSTALVADRAHFRAEILESVTLALLSELDRHPVHAAAVAREGRALLLAAPSGTGKSTLALVARSAGLDLMSEDRVWVQLRPAVRVWGWPDRVRTLPDDASPGHAKTAIDLRAEVSPSRLVASDVTVCVLAREGGPARLEPLAPDALARALEEQMAPGFDRFPDRWPAVAAALTAGGGWRMHLSSDPRDALQLVQRLLGAAPHRPPDSSS